MNKGKNVFPWRRCSDIPFYSVDMRVIVCARTWIIRECACDMWVIRAPAQTYMCAVCVWCVYVCERMSALGLQCGFSRISQFRRIAVRASSRQQVAWKPHIGIIYTRSSRRFYSACQVEPPTITIWLTSVQSSRERSSFAMAKRYTTIDEVLRCRARQDETIPPSLVVVLRAFACHAERNYIRWSFWRKAICVPTKKWEMMDAASQFCY